MMPITEILQAARERAQQLGLPYGGALLPQEAFQLSHEAPGARIVDVRTRAELDWVGRIPGAVEIELLSYPGNRPNPGFLAALQQQVDKESLVMFICRSGGRSHNAAMLAMQAGYTECYKYWRDSKATRTRTPAQHGGGWRKPMPWAQS
jgi:rhodanese-related sulfurtransferase